MTRTSTLLVLATLALVAACGGPAPAPKPVGGGKKVDTATAGSIAGRVTFTGTPPAPETIRMNSDLVCVQGSGPSPLNDAVLVGADGGLKNAFVYVKDGLDAGYSFDVPTAVPVLDQKGCRYTPRVLGVMVGQSLEIVNSDATTHNVHAIPMLNQEFNKGQQFQGMREKRTFTAPEVMVPFKCNVHSWMAAYVGVLAHPYFAISSETGAFEIKGLPPGTYTIEAWHEKFGTKTAQVTVGEKQAQPLSFTFSTSAQ